MFFKEAIFGSSPLHPAGRQAGGRVGRQAAGRQAGGRQAGSQIPNAGRQAGKERKRKKEKEN